MNRVKITKEDIDYFAKNNISKLTKEEEAMAIELLNAFVNTQNMHELQEKLRANSSFSFLKNVEDLELDVFLKQSMFAGITLLNNIKVATYLKGKFDKVPEGATIN